MPSYLFHLFIYLLQFEKEGHETIAHHKHRVDMKDATDKEILKEEGADLPHPSHFGSVELPGATE